MDFFIIIIFLKTFLDGKPTDINNVTKTSKKSQSASAKGRILLSIIEFHMPEFNMKL